MGLHFGLWWYAFFVRSVELLISDRIISYSRVHELDRSRWLLLLSHELVCLRGLRC